MNLVTQELCSTVPDVFPDSQCASSQLKQHQLSSSNLYRLARNYAINRVINKNTFPLIF